MIPKWRQKEHYAVLGPKTETAPELLSAVLRAQTGGSVANWIQGASLGLSQGLHLQNDLYTVHKSALRRTWLNTLGTSKLTNVAVSHSTHPTATFLRGKTMVILVLPASNPTVQDKDFLGSVAHALKGGAGKKIADFVVVLTGALTCMQFPSPPLDALDDWQRFVEGELAVLTPKELSAAPENWRIAADKIDKEWGNQLSGFCNSIVADGINLNTVPVCVKGFDTKTGAPASQETASQDCISFNLKTVAKILTASKPSWSFNIFERTRHA